MCSACPMCSAPSTGFKILGKRLNQSQGLSPKKKSGITTIVAKCRNCGLIFCNPQPLPLNIQDHYAIPPDSYWEKEKINNITSIDESIVKKLQSTMGDISSKKVLDIGAGLGKQMKGLSELGFDVHGIEPSETFFKKANELFNFDSEKFKCASIESAEFPSNYFDFIYFGAVLEHLPDPSLAISQAMKWLKPGGYAYIQVPSSKWLVAKLINFVYWIKRDDYVTNLSPMHPPYHLFEFSLESFRKNAVVLNYEIDSYTYSVCRTYMPKYFDWILRPVMRWTNTGMELYIWLKKK